MQLVAIAPYIKHANPLQCALKVAHNPVSPTHTHTKCERERERDADVESFQHKDTRVLSEPRYDLRKRTNSQMQQNSMLLLIHKFEELSLHEKNEENLSKKLKEGVDPQELSFPPFQIIF